MEDSVMPSLSQKLQYAQLKDPLSDVEGELDEMNVMGQYSIPGDRNKGMVGRLANQYERQYSPQDTMSVSMFEPADKDLIISGMFYGPESEKAGDVMQRIMMGATSSPKERDRIRKYLNKKAGVKSEK